MADIQITALGTVIKAVYEAEPNTNVFSDADQTKLDGIEAGATADQTGAEIKAAYEGEANAFTDAQFTKLAGIATGATANSSDATLLNRVNHTGTQSISTVTGLQTALDGKVTGPGSATDNAIVRFDSTTGALVQNSNLLVSDAGELTLPTITSPATPGANTISLVGRDVGGRTMPGFIGPSGIPTALQPHLGRNRMSFVLPTGVTTGVSSVGFQTPVATGTVTARAITTTNLYTRLRRVGYVSAGPAGSLSGVRSSAATVTTGAGSGVGGFHLILRFGFALLPVSSRAFAGMRNVTTAPTNVNPSTLTQTIGVAKIDGSNNLHIVYGGSAAQTPIDLGVNFPANTTLTDVYELTLFSPANNTGEVRYEVRRLNTGDTASGTLSGGATVLPSAATLLSAYRLWVSNNTTATAAAIDLFSVYLETNQ